MRYSTVVDDDLKTVTPPCDLETNWPQLQLCQLIALSLPRVSPPEDDVDLEALVNDMNSSLESLYSTCSGPQTESTPLLHNGQPASSQQQQHHHHHLHNHLHHQLNQHHHPHVHHNPPRQGHQPHAVSHVSPEPPASASASSSADSPQTSVRRSQPMHILAVRYAMFCFVFFPRCLSQI